MCNVLRNYYAYITVNTWVNSIFCHLLSLLLWLSVCLIIFQYDYACIVACMIWIYFLENVERVISPCKFFNSNVCGNCVEVTQLGGRDVDAECRQISDYLRCWWFLYIIVPFNIWSMPFYLPGMLLLSVQQ